MRQVRVLGLAGLMLALGLIVALAIRCASNSGGVDSGHGHDTGPLGAVSLPEGQKLRVVATTNIVGDVVRNVGGDAIDLTTLMGIGVDPHSYVPTPSDTAAVHDAHVLFANGAGLESNLDEILSAAGGGAIQVYVSEGITFLDHPMSGEPDDREGETGAAHEHEEEAEEGHGHDHEGVDPHVWFSVPNVIHWVEQIESTLVALDPANAQFYEENARAYVAELEALDSWILDKVARIPEPNRKLVTNHPTFGYFAERYGLEQVGAVYPLSPSAEPSARDVAALQDAIRELGVPAVFAESTVNLDLAGQVADDTGIRLVPLFSGSLSEPEDGAGSYIELMRYDVGAIVDALR